METGIGGGLARMDLPDNKATQFFGLTHSVELIRLVLIWKVPASRNTSKDMCGVEIE
jgi:hypothetical protein